MSDIYKQLSEALRTNALGTVLLTNLCFIIFAALIVQLAMRVAGATDDKNARNLNLLISLIGGLIGWIIGTAFSAFSDAEKSLFQSISSTVGVFLSGYVVSKLDRFIEGSLFPVKEAEVAWSRLGLFTAALLLASVTVFLNRLYAFQNPAVESHKKESVSAVTSTAVPKAASEAGAASGVPLPGASK